MVTSQQLKKYFEQYADVEVTFTRQVSQTLGLLPKFVFLKCQADTLPCIVYASSMREAKVLLSLRAGSRRLLQQADMAVSLRFCFERSERGGQPLAFYVGARVSALTAYNQQTPDLYLLSLEYTQRPPDDLIEMLGGLLEANSNAQKRSEVRVDIGPATLRTLGLDSREASFTLEGVESRCILRDLSFSGAKVLVHGSSSSYVDKPIVLTLSFSDSRQTVRLPGRVVRWEAMANREDIGAIGIRFDTAQVPMPYKLAINACLRGRK